MKKLILILVFVAVLIGASVWYVVSRYGVTDSAAVVPEETIAWIALPDLVQTSIRWNQTALAKIGADPAMQAFLEKPLGLIGEGGLEEATGILSRLKPGRMFASIISLDTTGVAALVGFQYFGARKDYDESLGRLHDEIGRRFPGAQRSELPHGGDTVTRIDLADDALFTAAHGSWGFLSNDEAVIKDALDRAAGRAATPSLSESENFRTVRSKLSTSVEAIWYVNPTPILDVLQAVGEAQGAPMNRSQFDQMRRVEAVGGSLSFNGPDQVERIFALMDEVPEMPSINHSGIAYTSPQDILFWESVQDWSTVADEDYLAGLPPEMAVMFESFGIDLAQTPEILGDEFVLLARWAPGAMFPTIMCVLDISDRAEVENIARRLAEGLAPSATISERQGATVFEFPMPGVALVDPAIAVTDERIVFALTSGSLASVLTPDPNRETLEASPTFQSVSAQWRQADQAFLFIDARTIFERIYNTARPMLVFGAAMSPEINQVIDINKLPDTEVIAKQLRPITMTQSVDSDGWLMESQGPFTIYQTAILGGAAFGFSWAMNTFMQTP